MPSTGWILTTQVCACLPLCSVHVWWCDETSTRECAMGSRLLDCSYIQHHRPIFHSQQPVSTSQSTPCSRTQESLPRIGTSPHLLAPRNEWSCKEASRRAIRSSSSSPFTHSLSHPPRVFPATLDPSCIVMQDLSTFLISYVQSGYAVSLPSLCFS